MLYKNIFDLVGNTPLLEIPKSLHWFKDINIYAKLEYFNPFWSVKDRTAFWLIRKHLDSIKKNKKIIIESSSWNTAKALTGFAGILGTNFETISNRINIQEQKENLELLGAKIKQVPGKSECPDPGSADNPLKLIEEKISKNPEKYFYTRQYENPENLAIHKETTGKEIWEDLEGKVDYFFAWLWTTGSSRWPASYIKEKNPNLKTIGIVSNPDDIIPWIRNSEEMWDVGLFDKNFYEKIEEVESLKALNAMKDLIQKAWVNWWPTTGASYMWVLQYIQKNSKNIPKNSNIVFVACDRFENYLSYIKQRKPELFWNNKKRDFCVFHISENKKVNYIHPDTLQKHLKNYLIIDTRSNISYKNMHIPKSINLPTNILYDLIDNKNIPFSRDKEIVLVCPNGKQHKKTTIFLEKKWYKTYILQWWFWDWIELWFPIEQIE